MKCILCRRFNDTVDMVHTGAFDCICVECNAAEIAKSEEKILWLQSYLKECRSTEPLTEEKYRQIRSGI